MSFKVIGVGEVLWDLLPSGAQLGGAPVNFAYHAKQLGADVQVVTRVGEDARGREILERFHDLGIDARAVQTDSRLPTGTATVTLNLDGTPDYSISDNAAWDNVELTSVILDAAREADAICFGTLAQRKTVAASTIQRLVAAAPSASWRVFDVNLRQEFYSETILRRSLELANVLKLNAHELTVLSSLFELKGDTRQKIETLSRRFHLDVVALTRAENGSLLYRSGNWSDLPCRKMDVVDTVGAGDAFTAALVMGLNQFDLEKIHRLASDIAGFVCSQVGATPVLPRYLTAAFIPNRINV
ncbi:MAG TPA: carbohydrate kinase [Verrucomicrobiae bacterium]|nr:carbohydrate kinase [Verrucomicrobiae bacterium]